MASDTPTERAAVMVDVSTLEMSSRGSITGVVSIQAGTVFFPEECWIDFPVVILGWWLDPVPRIRSGKSRSWVCRFMDGPFSARFEQQHEDTWQLSWLRDGRREFATMVSCREFVQSLSDAARKVLAGCAQRGWQTRDSEFLSSAVRSTFPEPGRQCEVDV